MSVTQADTLYWDTYDREIWENPYPIYKRMREEVPLYYNEEHDFYACLLYTSPSPRDQRGSRMPSSA